MEKEAKRSTITVLVVEDHYLTRTGLKMVVENSADFIVVGEADTGVAAIECAHQLQPDVILMDVSMPEMDGIDAARHIKQLNSRISIIMLTSNEDEEAICASLAAGASGYCLKDVQPERLYAAIKSVHEGDVWLDATIAAKVLKFYAGAGKSEARSAHTQVTAAAAAAAAAATSGEKSGLLSPRESEVIQLLVEGFSNQQIAERLVISLPTAKSHVRSILNKLAVNDRTQAAVQAMRRGLV